MFGLFLENGPLRVLETSPNNFNVDLRPGGSWGDIADIIFLDQPAGVGFSYFDKKPCDRLECGAIEVVQLLNQILGMYKEYQGRQLIISGESYAGKYVPHIAKKCQEEAAKNPNFFKLTGILLGDPLVNPIPQRLARYKIAEGLGIIDKRHMGAISALNRRCLETASANWTEGNDECSATIDYAIDVSGDTFSYDASIFDPDWDLTMHEDDVKHYITTSPNKEQLYQAIHVADSTKNPKFNWSSRPVADAYEFEEMSDWSVWYDLVAQPRNVSIVIYAGMYDMLDGPLTHDPWIRLLKSVKSDNGALFDQPRKIFYVQNPVTQQYEVGGYYRSDESIKFTFLTIPKSGHFVPITEQLSSRTFLNDIITKGSLQCHKANAQDCETGAIMCGYMDKCNNAGTCNPVTGRCECTDPEVYGSDCSEQWIKLPLNQTYTGLQGI
jgi:carboxypeptidase C (cathepsin A)